MQVSVESTGNLERRLTVEVPAEQIDNEVEGRLRSLTKTARVDGFRRGKVPLNIVKKMYGNKVRQEVIGDVLQRSFYEALTKEKLQPAGTPNIEPKVTEPGKAFEYTAVFEVYPEVNLAPLDGVEIDKPVAELTEQDIAEMIEKIRKQRSSWSAVERAAQKGDRVVIDFVGTIDNKPFDGNEAEEFPVELGAGRLMAGFEEQLEGVKAGDETTLNLSFPQDYHKQDLAGKPVAFSVKVHRVEAAQLPEVDEAFIKGLGVQEGTLEALQQELRRSMENELENALRARQKRHVSDKLYEINKIELPKALIDQEVVSLKKQMELPEDALEGQADFLRKQAQQRVALGMIFSEIIKLNHLTAPPERLRAQIDKLAANYDDPGQVVAWYYGDQKRLADIESVVMEDVIVDWVLDQVKVNEVPTTFATLMAK